MRQRDACSRVRARPLQWMSSAAIPNWSDAASPKKRSASRGASRPHPAPVLGRSSREPGQNMHGLIGVGGRKVIRRPLAPVVAAASA